MHRSNVKNIFIFLSPFLLSMFFPQKLLALVYFVTFKEVPGLSFSCKQDKSKEYYIRTLTTVPSSLEKKGIKIGDIVVKVNGKHLYQIACKEHEKIFNSDFMSKYTFNMLRWNDKFDKFELALATAEKENAHYIKVINNNSGQLKGKPLYEFKYQTPLKSGDRILKINGECVDSLDHDEVVKLLRVENGTVLTVEILSCGFEIETEENE